ncbi:MAG: hypothetical protein JW716_04560 [Candidatus Aenigmarchaeota archaeon]|nr:hypothetical protein [Candidatus Aenigmarchaeota archaeon]
MPKKASEPKKSKTVPEGTLRISSKELNVYEKTKSGWEKSDKQFPNAMHVIDLFKAHDNFDILTDKKNPKWLKGQVSPEGKLQGARINVLPDGRQLDKAFSLFAEELTIHDATTNDHWDVLYRNPGGTYSYVYTLEKDAKTRSKKYQAVGEFERVYPILIENVRKALFDENDDMAVPMYTLLKTLMRIGNEIYFKAHGHKGLTTLKKKDVTIRGKHVTFKYLAKNGVPSTTTRKFPGIYVDRLSKRLSKIKMSDFVFANTETGHPLSESAFKHAFARYCGEEFYPHIVRSYYGTKRAEDFLKNNNEATKKEVRRFFLSVADKLNHKRFVKKKGIWTESWTVTVNHYIRPELVEKIKKLSESNL